MFETSFVDILKAISIFVLFIIVFFGAFYTTKLLGKYQMKQGKQTSIKVIEAISIGVNKNLQLVKVGSSYILIAVTKDHVTYIKDIPVEQLDLRKVDKGMQMPFSKYLDKFNKDKDGENRKD